MKKKKKKRREWGGRYIKSEGKEVFVYLIEKNQTRRVGKGRE